jgi:2-keto-4-pentenoate hydratase
VKEDHVSAASDLLWRHWQEGRRLAALPDELRPTTRAEGYAIQALLEQRTGSPLFGWRIAATSRDGQAHIGVDGPIAGRLLAERVIPDGGLLELGANHMRVAEPEFAFRLTRDLTPRETTYGVDEVLAAIGTLHPAIEVPDSRYDDFTIVGAPQLIGDDACAHWFVLGPEAPSSWRSLDLAAHAVRGKVTSGVEREGRGANVLGDPRTALTWLVNELSSLGVTLRAGQVVTTGTCLAPLPIVAGDEVAADFGPLGRVTLHLTQ